MSTYGISGIPAFCVHQVPQYRGVPEHGGKAVLGKGLPHVKGRLHIHNGRRRVFHIVANGVEDDVGLSDLRRTLNYYLWDMRVPNGVHDLPLVGRFAGMPPPRLRAAFWA